MHRKNVPMAIDTFNIISNRKELMIQNCNNVPANSHIDTSISNPRSTHKENPKQNLQLILPEIIKSIHDHTPEIHSNIPDITMHQKHLSEPTTTTNPNMRISTEIQNAIYRQDKMNLFTRNIPANQ